MNQSPPANSPLSSKDNHEPSHHEALVFCSTLSPGRQCTHHKGAVTLSRASCSRASMLQGSGERCEDKVITVVLLSIKKKNMCVYMGGETVPQNQGCCICCFCSVFLCWTDLHCLWLSCAPRDFELPWFRQLITSCTLPFSSCLPLSHCDNQKQANTIASKSLWLMMLLVQLFP